VLWRDLITANHERPLGLVYLTLTGAASGTDPELHALWGFLTHLACVVSVFFLARALGMGTLPAAVLGLLVMVFPFSDSIWLWYSASHASIAIALAACGALLALRGLRGQRAWPWHLGAAAAFAASVLTYQVIAITVLLMVAIYWPRTDRRTALLLWAKDIAAVVAAALIPSLIAGHRGINAAPLVDSVADGLDHAELILDQGFTLLARSLVPFGTPTREVVLAVAVVILLGGVVQASRAAGEAADHAHRWLGWALAGVGIVITGYVIYVPAVARFYMPLAGGSDNRINALTGIGFALVALALAMLVAGFLLNSRRWPRRWTPVLAAALVLPIAIGYYQRVDDDIDDWSRAADEQAEQLAQLREIGRPPADTTDYVYGGVGQTAPRVFAFGVTWDLHAATQIAWDDYPLRAFPIFHGTRMICEPTHVVPKGPANGIGPTQGGIYPNVLFTDLRTGERVRVRNEADCERAAERFEPGPATG